MPRHPVRVELKDDAPASSERDALFRDVFDHAALGVLVLDAAGRIVRVNEKLYSMLGYREGELCGLPISALKHPDDVARDLELREEMLSAGRAEAHVETRYRTRAGAWLWVRITASVGRDEQGGGLFTIALVEDITEARRTKEALRVSEERYRTLVRHLPNTSVLLFDRELRYVLADGDKLFQTAGTSRDQIVGRHLVEVAAPENFIAVEQAYRATLAGRSEQFEILRNGVCLAIHTAPVHGDDGLVSGGMVLAYDITTLKKTEAALREQTAAVVLLEDIASASNKARTSADAFRHALSRIGAHLACPLGHVYLRDGNELVPSGFWHVLDPESTVAFREATKNLRFMRGEGLVGGVLTSSAATWLHDADRSPSFLRRRELREAGLRSGFAFPVLVGEEVVAVLEFFSANVEAPNAQTLLHMSHVCSQLGRVVERERHAAAAQSLSLRDEMTGLLNRRGFLELGRQQHQVALRSGRSFALLFADVDGLKGINDNLGHDAGDRALRDAADALRWVFRESDLVARLGGDEFVVLAVDAEQGSTSGLRARVHAAVQAFNAAGRGRPYTLSMSLGVTTFDPKAPESLDMLLAAADAAMYVQKRAARER